MSNKDVYKYPLTPPGSSCVSIPSRNRGNEETEDTLVHGEDNVDQKEKLNNAAADKRTFDSHRTRRPSDSTKNNFEEHFVSNASLAFRTSKGVEVNHESQNRDEHDKIEPSVQASIILDQNCAYTYPLTPPPSSSASIPNQNRNNEERCDTQGHVKENKDEVEEEVEENHEENGEDLETSQIGDMPTTKDQIQDENSNKEERSNTQVHEKENEDEEKEEVAENLQENVENLVTSQNRDMPTTPDQIQDENSNKEERSNTQVHEKEIEDEEKEDVAENLQENVENLVTSQNRDMPTTMDQIQDEDSLADFKLLADSTTLLQKIVEKVVEVLKFNILSHNALQLKNTVADIRTFDSHGTRRPSDSTKTNFEKHFVSNKTLASQRSKGVDVKSESQKRDIYNKIKQFHHQSMLLESQYRYDYPRTPPVSSDVSIPNQNINKEERCNTQVNEKENKDDEKEEVAENLKENGENLVTSQNLDMPTTQDQIQDEVREVTRLRPEPLSNNWKMFLPEELRKSFIKTLKSMHSEDAYYNITTLSEGTVEKLEEVSKCNMLDKIALKNAVADKRTIDSLGTRRLSDSTKNNFEEHFVSNENLASQRSKGVEVKSESQKRDKDHEIKQPFHNPSMILESKYVKKYKMTPPVSSDVSIPNQNSNKEERCNTQVNEKENEDDEKEEVAENLQENGENLVTSQNLDMPATQDQIQDENSNKEERCNTQVNEKENEDDEKEEVAKNLQENGENLVTSQNRDMPATQDQIQDENSTTHFKLPVFRITTSEKTGEKPGEDFKLLAYSTTSSEEIKKLLENSTTHFKLPVFRITTSEKTVEKPGENNIDCDMKDSFADVTQKLTKLLKRDVTYKINVLAEEVRRNFINRLKSIHSEINVLPEEVRRNFFNRSKSKHSKLKNEAADKRSTFESTLSRLYRNVIRNDTSRMMSSIGMVGFEAEHLFGLERSQIFFNLLDEELCQFGSTGAISDFVPNMAESTVRQHVISFFEHAYDMMSRLMTLLLRCPDNKILQQMPVQNFISLMKSVIKSSLKAQTKGREKLSLDGNIYTMVDPKDLERVLGEEIPEAVLNRLRNEDEMVVHRFVDTRLERHQPSDRRENRPGCIYFPSDCRLFISIPTETGSYWHRLDMQRADRIRRHNRYVI